MEENTKKSSHDLQALGIIFNEEKLTCRLKNFKIPNSEFEEDLDPLLSEITKGSNKEVTARIKGIQKIITFFQLVDYYYADIDVEEILKRLLEKITIPPRHLIYQEVKENPKKLRGMDPNDIRFMHQGKKYILLRQRYGNSNKRKITELDPAFSMCFYLFLQEHACLNIAVYNKKKLRRGVAAEEVTHGIPFHILKLRNKLPSLNKFNIKTWSRFFFANLLFEDSDAHDGNVLVVPAKSNLDDDTHKDIVKIDYDRCFCSETGKYFRSNHKNIQIAEDGVYVAPVKSFEKITVYDLEHLPFVEDAFLDDGLVNGRYAQYMGKSHNKYFKGIDKNPEFIAEKYKCSLISLLLPSETFYNIFALNVVSIKRIEEYSKHIVDRISHFKSVVMLVPQFWHYVIDHPEWLSEIIAEFNLINEKFANLIDVSSIEKNYFTVYKEIAKNWEEYIASQLRFPTQILPESSVIKNRAAKIDEFYSGLYPQFDMGMENNSSLYSEFGNDDHVVPPNISNQMGHLVQNHENNLKLIENILDIQEGVEKLRNYSEVMKLENLYKKSNAIFNRIDDYLMMMKRDPAYYGQLEARYISFQRELFELLDKDTEALTTSINQNDYSLIKMKIDFGRLSLADILQTNAMDSALRQGRVYIVRLFFELQKKQVKQSLVTTLDILKDRITSVAVDYYLRCFDSNKSFFSKKHNLSQRCQDIGELFIILNKEHQDVAALISEITNWANQLKCGLLPDLNNGWRLGRSELRNVIMRAIAVYCKKSDKETGEAAPPSSTESPVTEDHSIKIVDFPSNTSLQFYPSIENNSSIYFNQVDEPVKVDNDDLLLIENILNTQEKVEGLKGYFEARGRGNMREKSNELLEQIDDYLVMMKIDSSYYRLLNKRQKQFQEKLFELIDEATETLAVNIDRDEYSLIKMKIDLGRLSLADVWQAEAMGCALKLGRTHIVKLFFEFDKKMAMKPQTNDSLDVLMGKISNAARDYYLECFEKGSSQTSFFKSHDLSQRCRDINRLFKILEQKHKNIDELKFKITRWGDNLKCGLMPNPENGWRLGRSELRDEVMKVMGVSDDTAAAEAVVKQSSSMS